MSRKFTAHVKSLFSEHGYRSRSAGYDDSGSTDSPAEPEEFTSDDPEVNLSGEIKPNRNEEQKKRIDAILNNPKYPAPILEDGDLIFDPSPEWAYAILKVSGPQQTGTSLGASPLGNRPSQPKKKKSTAVATRTTTPEKLEADLVLFNVLVALEWEPCDDYLRTLEWAFRRASDYLYDVTDGKMAFGQVIFGGREWMDCADIQIMASNRFHPRSWVNGLHMHEKYLPIRLGRGYWFHSSRVTIPWDEPEAYRVLVHEWAHYALNQKDAYLQLIDLLPASEIGTIRLGNLSRSILVPSTDQSPPLYKAVVQRVRESSDSIMATTLGTSELVPHAGGCLRMRKNSEWDKIRKIPAFKELKQNPPLEGPGRLPLPLPQFVQLSGTTNVESPLFPPLNSQPASQDQPAKKRSAMPEADKQLQGIPPIPPELLPRNTPAHQCWLYVIKNLNGEQPRLIAQGTLDAHAADNGFRLLGALAGDTVVLVAKSTLDKAYGCGKDRVLLHTISTEYQAPNNAWKDVTPEIMPLLNVQPCNLGANMQDERLAQIRVQISGNDDQRPDTVWVFPLGQEDPSELASLTTPLSVPTLDGHVLTVWEEKGDKKLMITSFSQGGCPPSGGAFAPVPITAGSSDGRVMLFFYDPDNQDNGDVSKEVADRREAYSRVKVITTINSGVADEPPAPGARPASYAFSLASNSALPAECFPTLAIHHDALSEVDALTGHLVICRLDLERGSWKLEPTYNQAGANVAVTPLTPTTTPDLVMAMPEGGAKPATVPPHYYQLFWIPRD
ncbi:MAG TPA: hypothetical protein VGD69_27545 [Herpetosiphonaceae bacterium]